MALENSRDVTRTLTTIVRTVGTCQGNDAAYTMCVTVKPAMIPFGNPERPFHKLMLDGIKFASMVLLLFIPAFFMTMDLDDRVVAETLIMDQAGNQIGRATVTTQFEASLDAGKFGRDGVRQVYGLANKDLANRVVLELKRHPHWFEVAR